MRTEHRNRVWKKEVCYYTIGFLSIAAVIIYLFLSNGKTFIRWTDGIAQHFVALKYIRSYLLNIFSGGIHLPMVDLSIGQGLDVIGTLNYYGFGDPVTLLTVLFPANALEEMYAVLILVRMYLAGLFFLLYCREISWGEKGYAHAAAGALLYAFCNFAMMGGMKHPMFLNGVMYLPLLLVGVERVFKKKSMVFLSIGIALAFMSNYYFMYMNTIMVGIYVLIRLWGSYKELGVKGFFGLIGKLLLSYLWGVCLAAVIVFPAVYAFLHNARGNFSENVGVLYKKEYYQNILETFFTPSDVGVGKWAVPGVAPAGLAGLFILLADKKDWKKNRHILIAFGISILLLFCPMAGKAMNGFAYVSNRWCYGMAFIFALSMVCALDIRKELFIKQKVGALAITILFILSIYGFGIRKVDKMVILLNMGILVSVVILLVCSSNHRFWKRILQFSLAFLILTGNFLNIEEMYGQNFYDRTTKYVNKGKSNSILYPAQIKIFQNVKLDEGYRAEIDDGRVINKGAYTGIATNQYYFSVIPNDLKELYVSLGIADYAKAASFHGLNDFTILHMLTSTKYLSISSNHTVPYGYEKVSEYTGARNRTAALYFNQMALPIGYTYDAVLDETLYWQMSPTERQVALLEYAVVKNNNIEDIESEDTIFDDVISRIPVQINKDYQNGSVIKIEKNETLEFAFEGKSNSETYLVLTDASVSDSLKGLDKITTEGVRCGKIEFSEPKYCSGMEHDAMVINLGYSDEPQKNCSMCFNKSGNIQFSSTEIVCVSMEVVEQEYENRSADSFTDISITDNRISGNITVPDSRIFQLTVPYSTGWTAYVDGKKTEISKCGIAYMGINLSAGEHEIVFTYRSPGIVLGAVLSLFGLLGVLADFICGKKKRA